jgi:hypothetical protein
MRGSDSYWKLLFFCFSGIFLGGGLLGLTACGGSSPTFDTSRADSGELAFSIES